MVVEAKIESDVIYGCSKIQKFYEGSRIFITGGSGFLGILLIQKLIRDCPGISKLYLMIRPKKGKTAAQRLEEMFKDPVFERMKMEQPKFTKKINLIIGDMEQPSLGINEEDKQLLSQEVDIVFHLAATVRFDEQIKKAAAINVQATINMIELAKTFINLKVFMYISTAYSHCYQQNIDEEIYDISMSSDRFLKITEALTIDESDILTPKLIEGWPNTYCYTKAIAESVIKKHGKALPVGIFRPSMITSTYKEPVESWINNFYGPVGGSMAVSAGILRVANVSKDLLCDIVPGDCVINSLIAIASHIGSTFNQKKTRDYSVNNIFDEIRYSNDVPVFNYVSSIENPITWRDFYSICQDRTMQWQTIHSIWYVFIIMTTNPYLLKFYNFFLQKLPAYIIDLYLLAIGKKQRMVKLNKKIENFLALTDFFANHEWKFKNDNTQALWQNLSKLDQKIFPFSMKELDWYDYFENYGKGVRLYLFKDPLDTVPKARAKYQKLKIAHYSLVTLLCLIVTWVVFRILQLFSSVIVLV